MNRLDQLTGRFPPIYSTSEDSVLYAFIALFANSMEAFDIEMNRVQRSHWIDTAFDRIDLVKLGVLFDIPDAPWEPDHLYRIRLKATVAARLQGAVTRPILEFVLMRILDGAQQTLGIRYCDIPKRGSAFATEKKNVENTPVFKEFPKKRVRSKDLIQKKGFIKSIQKFTLNNKGLYPVALQGIMRGIQDNMTAVPVLANLTNGTAMIYKGLIPCGAELSFTSENATSLSVRYNREDASSQVYTTDQFSESMTLDFTQEPEDNSPIIIERGENILWFFPLALYDKRVLDSGVYAMPTTDLQHGRYGDKAKSNHTGTPFDTSLFDQQPAVSLDLFWDEDSAAQFRFEIPTGCVRRKEDYSTDFDADQSRLLALLDQTVRNLRAAGVDGRVVARPNRTTQKLQDRMKVLNPKYKETMRLESRLQSASALFDKNAVDGSRFI